MNKEFFAGSTKQPEELLVAGISFSLISLGMLQKTVLNELAIWFWLMEREPLILNEWTAKPVFGLLYIISLIPSQSFSRFLLFILSTGDSVWLC